jgi:tRNA-specific 2-thiouridylase
LGISWSEPLYVISIREEEDSIVVGTKSDLQRTSLNAKDINLIMFPEIIEPLHVKAKIRYKSKEAPAVIYPEPGNKIRCEFEHPESAITPGQAVVFYRDDYVLGGGTIENQTSLIP